MCLFLFIFRRIERDSTQATPEDILSAEKFMREHVLDSHDKRNNNRQEMLEKFVLTRQARREFIAKEKTAATTILNKYPRLKDMQEAVRFHFTVNN